MNDPDEFNYKLDYEPTQYTKDLLAELIARKGNTNIPPHMSAALVLQSNSLEPIARQIIKKYIEKSRSEIGITSFSAIKNNPNLWHRYGGEGNGVCVEINIPDSLLGKVYHKVQYVHEKKYHVDFILEAALYPSQDNSYNAYRNMLLTKTTKWSDEKEVRFIGKRQEVGFVFDGYISEITFGANVPQSTLDKLYSIISAHCADNNIRIG